jgi:isopentenyl-diphosphate Delta-isomerase
MDGPEMLDALHADGRPTGATIERDRAHAEGVWHGAVHVWVLTPSGSVILQRRARTKDLGGGCIDVSVGGHLAAGETWLAGLREAEEELGLVLAFGDVAHLGRFPSERAYPDGRIDREWQDELVAVVDQPLDAYTVPCAEVAVLYEVPLARAVALWRDGAPVAAAGWDCQQRVNDALLIDADLIAPARAGTLAALERVAAWWAEREPV